MRNDRPETTTGGYRPAEEIGADLLRRGPADDLWRVDIGGMSVSVRGEEACRHLERVRREIARMKMALHKISMCAPADVARIATEALNGRE